MYVRVHYACWLVGDKTGPDGWQAEEGAGVLIVHKTERIMWPCCDHKVTCLSSMQRLVLLNVAAVYL